MNRESEDDEEAMLVELGARARERLERGTAAMLDPARRSPEFLSEAELSFVTEAVLERTAPAANDTARSRTSRTIAYVVTAASLAAALLLWFVMDREPATTVVRYEGTFEGGLRETRDAGPADDASVDTVARLRPGSPVRWTFVPETAVHGRVDVSLELVSDSQTRCLPVSAVSRTTHERGGLQIDGTAEGLFGVPPGRWTVRAIVGSSSAFDLSAPCSLEPGLVVADQQEIELLDGAL